MSDLAAAQAALDATRERERRVKLGPPLSLGDGELDVLATPGDGDIPDALALWREANPGAMAGLLNAKTEGG